MRKVSTLVGITLSALTATASAQEATPAPAPAAPATEPPAMTAPAPTAAAAPTPIAATTTAEPAKKQPPKFEVGLALMPMALGKFTLDAGDGPQDVDAAFAYGGSLSVSYEVLPGLLIGVAPQLILNVKEKTAAAKEKAKEIDLLARVAYAYRPVEEITVYAEVLPGYSQILPSAGFTAKGFVLAFGLGTTMNFTERYFASFALGYQVGFQSHEEDNRSFETSTKFVRVALGGGARF